MNEPNGLPGTWLAPNYYDVATYVDDVAFYHSVMEPLHIYDDGTMPWRPKPEAYE